MLNTDIDASALKSSCPYVSLPDNEQTEGDSEKLTYDELAALVAGTFILILVVILALILLCLVWVLINRRNRNGGQDKGGEEYIVVEKGEVGRLREKGENELKKSEERD